MLTKIGKLITNNFGAKHKLIKAIREDSYKNWVQHFDAFNQTAEPKANPAEMKSFGMEVYEHNLKQCLSNLRITDDKRNLLLSIQSYFVLPSDEIYNLKRKYGLKAVDLLSKYRVQDLDLTPNEKYEIQLLANELNVTSAEVDNINKQNAADVFQKIIKDKVAVGRITDTDIQEINKVANSLSIIPAAFPVDTKTKQQYEYLVMLNELEKGYLPVIHSSAIVAQKDEIVHWQTNATLLTPKTVTTGYVGGSRGVSIRVMKGVSYRVGSSRSTPIRETITMRNPGNLVVTNKRIVFTGTGKSFSIGYKQLLSFDPYNNGIGLQKTNGPSYLLELQNFQASEVTFKMLENAINKFFA